MNKAPVLVDLLAQVRACRLCEGVLPLGPRPVVQAASKARLLIIGQAPGTRVHETGIPWNDPSGERLRSWLKMDKEQFYDADQVAIVPMGFCYPGRGRGGDLPPRPECAPAWHQALLDCLPEVEMTLLIGRFAQRYYLKSAGYKLPPSLTETVRQWQQWAPRFWPLVHPSPRNRRWLATNPWFEEEVVPALGERVAQLMAC